MGIYIELKRVGDAITDQEWQAVYEETLLALEKYPFADRLKEDTGLGREYHKTVHAKERSLLPVYNGNGWSTIGDMETYQYAEPFVLVRNNGYYKEAVSYDEGKNILECITKNQPYVSIWDNKTQGEPYHIPLLAIACLIEDRLQGKVMVQGNIRNFEVEEACKCINEYVTKPIGYPLVMDAHRLITQLQAIHKGARQQLKHFFNLYTDLLDNQIRELLEQSVGKKRLAEYYQYQLSVHAVEQEEFIQIVQQMLQIGFELEEVGNIFITAKERNQGEIEGFIEHILAERVSVYFLKKEEIYIPGNIEGQMIFAFDALAGYNRNKHEMFGEERQSIIDTLNRCFSFEVNDINEIAVRVSCREKAKEEACKRYLNLFNTVSEKQRKLYEDYDIVSADELVKWQLGKTIAPELEAHLDKILKSFRTPSAITVEAEEIINLTHDKTKLFYMLTQISTRFLLPDIFWKYIKKNIDRENVIKAIVLLFFANATRTLDYEIIKYTLCNTGFLEEYILARM